MTPLFGVLIGRSTHNQLAFILFLLFYYVFLHLPVSTANAIKKIIRIIPCLASIWFASRKKLKQFLSYLNCFVAQTEVNVIQAALGFLPVFYHFD